MALDTRFGPPCLKRVTLHERCSRTLRPYHDNLFHYCLQQAWEEKAAELDADHLDRWREEVAASLTASAWGGSSSALDQVIVNVAPSRVNDHLLIVRANKITTKVYCLMNKWDKNKLQIPRSPHVLCFVVCAHKSRTSKEQTSMPGDPWRPSFVSCPA